MFIVEMKVPSNELISMFSFSFHYFITKVFTEYE